MERARHKLGDTSVRALTEQDGQGTNSAGGGRRCRGAASNGAHFAMGRYAGPHGACRAGPRALRTAAVTMAFAVRAASTIPCAKRRANRAGLSSKSLAPPGAIDWLCETRSEGGMQGRRVNAPVIVMIKLGRGSFHGPCIKKLASNVGEVVSAHTRYIEFSTSCGKWMLP